MPGHIAALSEAATGSAALLYAACEESADIGVVFALGRRRMIRNTAWAIAVEQLPEEGFELVVDEFWSAEVWTGAEHRGSECWRRPCW